MPDRETWTIWYSLLALGVVASVALSGLVGIPFFYSIWITVPAFLLFGNLALKRWMKSIGERAKIASTPIALKEVPGLGTLRQLPEQWALDLKISDQRDNVVTLPVTFDCGPVGPSDHQVQLVQAFARKYSVLLPELIARLEAHLARDSPPDDFASIDVSRQSVNVYPEDQAEDLEVTFETKEHQSDMFCVLLLKDWKIVDLYGAD